MNSGTCFRYHFLIDLGIAGAPKISSNERISLAEFAEDKLPFLGVNRVPVNHFAFALGTFDQARLALFFRLRGWRQSGKLHFCNQAVGIRQAEIGDSSP